MAEPGGYPQVQSNGGVADGYPSVPMSGAVAAPAAAAGYPPPQTNGGPVSPQLSSRNRSPLLSRSRGSAGTTTSLRSGVKTVGGIGRSPSPQRINVNDLDHRSIIALSQTCTEDLTQKMREKNTLMELMSELKKKKMQYEAKGGKKKREVDSTIVQTMDMEKKLQQLANTNKMMTSELMGLRSENERLEADVESLRRDFKEASDNYAKECKDVEEGKKLLYSYRKEINAEAKQRENVQQDLRASRTAQNLMINRLDDMEKRNRALKSCVANTFNG